jgi:hypothetical protein
VPASCSAFSGTRPWIPQRFAVLARCGPAPPSKALRSTHASHPWRLALAATLCCPCVAADRPRLHVGAFVAMRLTLPRDGPHQTPAASSHRSRSHNDWHAMDSGTNVARISMRTRAPLAGIPILAERLTAPNWKRGTLPQPPAGPQGEAHDGPSNHSLDDPGGVVELAPRASARSPRRNKPDRGAIGDRATEFAGMNSEPLKAGPKGKAQGEPDASRHSTERAVTRRTPAH